MQVNYTACDLCERNVSQDHNRLEIAAKKHRAIGNSYGTSKEVIVICSNCQERLKRMFSNSTNIGDGSDRRCHEHCRSIKRG